MINLPRSERRAGPPNTDADGENLSDRDCGCKLKITQEMTEEILAELELLPYGK